jgi:hypothetical protein
LWSWVSRVRLPSLTPCYVASELGFRVDLRWQTSGEARAVSTCSPAIAGAGAACVIPTVCRWVGRGWTHRSLPTGRYRALRSAWAGGHTGHSPLPSRTHHHGWAAIQLGATLIALASAGCGSKRNASLAANRPQHPSGSCLLRPGRPRSLGRDVRGSAYARPQARRRAHPE